MVRLKNRYLLINILYPQPRTANSASGKECPDIVHFHQPSSDQLSSQILTRTIRDKVTSLFGDYGAGMIAGSLAVKYLSPATSTAIIRVTRSHYRLVWAALTFITELRLSKSVNEPCVIQVVRVSGTIRKAEEEAIRRARESMMKARRQVEEKQAASSSIGVGGQVRMLAPGKAGGLLGGDLDEDEPMGEVVQRGIESDDSDGDDDGD